MDRNGKKHSIKPMKVIIDTDVAMGVIRNDQPSDVDDAFAIAGAINASAINLLGVTTVSGNAPFEDVNRVANQIIHQMRANVPILKGASHAKAMDSNDAVEFIAEGLAKTQLHICAIGPLTNIGLLVRKYPERIVNIASIVFVGGRSVGREFYIGNKGPVGDFNFEQDPVAAKMVLDTKIPLVLAGFELTSQVTLTREHVQRLHDNASETCTYFAQESSAWLEFWIREFHEEGFHPWDSSALHWLTNPEWFTSERRGGRIRTERDVPKLETDKHLPDRAVIFLTGFERGCKERFANAVVAGVF